MRWKPPALMALMVVAFGLAGLKLFVLLLRAIDPGVGSFGFVVRQLAWAAVLGGVGLWAADRPRRGPGG